MSATINYVSSVHIGTGTNSSATTLAGIQKGDLFLVNASTMAVLTGTSAAALTQQDRVFVASGIAPGQFHKSIAFGIKDIERLGYGGTKYAAPTTQRSYVGYNELTATGALSIADQTEYTLDIVIKDDQRVQGQKQTRELYSFLSYIGALQYQAAFGVAGEFGIKSMNGSYKRYKGRFVDMEVVSNATTLGTNVNSVQVVKGSRQLIFNGVPTFGAGPTTIAPGMYLAFTNSDATVGHYLVTEVTGDVVIIDQPFNNNSATLAAGQVAYYTTTQAGTANYGFRITAQSVIWNNIDTYEIVAFDASFFPSLDTSITDLNSAPYTMTTAPFGGLGYFRQVYDLEYFAAGNNGINSRTRWYDADINPPALTDVSGATTYNLMTINLWTEALTDFQNRRKYPVNITVAIPKLNNPPVTGTQEYQTGAANTLNFTGIVNAFLATVGGLPVINFT
jgi:hypothetical protein